MAHPVSRREENPETKMICTRISFQNAKGRLIMNNLKFLLCSSLVLVILLPFLPLLFFMFFRRLLLSFSYDRCPFLPLFILFSVSFVFFFRLSFALLSVLAYNFHLSYPSSPLLPSPLSPSSSSFFSLFPLFSFQMIVFLPSTFFSLLSFFNTTLL